MLVVNLMIILFHIKFEKFYCTGVMNYLKVTCYDFSSLTTLYSIKMSEKTHKYKQQNDLNWVNVDQILISDKFKHSDDGFKYFIGYKKNDIVRLLCIILPQISGYIKYFKNGGKKYVLQNYRW